MDESAQRIGRRRLRLSLVGTKHALEGVHGSEDNFGKLCAVPLTDLPREDIFQFVSDLAQLLETTGSRIAL